MITMKNEVFVGLEYELWGRGGGIKLWWGKENIS